jgi:hypothetical protein
MTSATSRFRRSISYAAATWAILFAALHTWWALGISAGFPGGEANHRLMMSSVWRYAYDVVVILLSITAAVVAVILLRPTGRLSRPWIPRAAAWIACGMLSLRGIAGAAVDGLSDPVWWPTFLTGGILFGALAWLARGGRDMAVTSISGGPPDRQTR